VCLIVFSYRPDAPRKLILLANRDEFHERPSAQAAFWPDRPEILAGRDLEAGGTWLGLNRRGCLAAVTNYRQVGREVPRARSRGELAVNFLQDACPALAFARRTAEQGHRYNGFSLLLYDGTDLVYVSNRDGRGPFVLHGGIHGLSNHLLDTPWPKVRRARERLSGALKQGDMPLRQLLPILHDTRTAADADLPDTGIGIEMERLLSACCIRSENYGTRCSTGVEIRTDGGARLIEQTLVPAGLVPDTVTFEVDPAPSGP